MRNISKMLSASVDRIITLVAGKTERVENMRKGTGDAIITVMEQPSILPTAGQQKTATEIRRAHCEKEALQYEQKGDFWIAAKEYEETGNLPKAQEIWGKAAQVEKQKNNFRDAAEAYENAGYLRKAQEMLLKLAGQLGRNGNFSRTAEVYERIIALATTKAKGMWLKAAQKEEKLGELKRAAELYEKGGDTTKAQEMWLKIAQEEEERERGLHYWFKNNAPPTAGEEEAQRWHLAHVAHNADNAKERIWHLKNATSSYENAGNLPKAQEMWLKLAQEYENAGNPIKAAEIRSGRLSQ